MQPAASPAALARSRPMKARVCPVAAGCITESGSRLPQSGELALDNGDIVTIVRPVEKFSDLEQTAKGTRDWPHAPPHRLGQAGVYFLTARAKEGRHLFAEDSMKDWFEETLFTIAAENAWRLEAWAVLSNHYHFIAHVPKGPEEEGAASVRNGIRKLHSLATKECNRRDGTPGRTRLWQNFRETRLTHQESYLARLNYVHQNAVHHGLVAKGSDWKWCSALKFQKAVTPAWVKTVASFRYDEIAQKDGE